MGGSEEMGEEGSSSPVRSRILTNEIIAAKSKILTKRSSNCSKTSCQIVFPSSVGSSARERER